MKLLDVLVDDHRCHGIITPLCRMTSQLQQTVRRLCTRTTMHGKSPRPLRTRRNFAAAGCASGQMGARSTRGAGEQNHADYRLKRGSRVAEQSCLGAGAVRSTARLCRMAHIRFSGTRNRHLALCIHANVSSHRVEVSLVCRPVCGARAVGCFFRGGGWLSAAGFRLAPPCGQPQ